MNQYFHFTLGPVQGFVAQSRRTRDFWAGSFILSWLSAVAMKAVEKQDGSIVFPMPNKAFMKAIEKGGDGPKQGCIPNRFMAKVGNDFDQKQVTAAVQAAWKALADEVWKKDLQGITNGKAKEVWIRQISAFWDIEWAMVQDKSATNTLDRLKNWRTHPGREVHDDGRLAGAFGCGASRRGTEEILGRSTRAGKSWYGNRPAPWRNALRHRFRQAALHALLQEYNRNHARRLDDQRVAAASRCTFGSLHGCRVLAGAVAWQGK